MPALTLKVFISSPGDVGQERILAQRVLERLKGAFGGFVDLQPILWEHEPLRATAHFQEQILPPSQTDIVVCILWSRLGTRLPEQFVRADGTHYASGTEWEFEDAARAHRDTGKPDLLVYRKTAAMLVELGHEEYEDRLAQKKALEAFLNRWFGNPYEAFRAAFHQVQSPEHFEDLLETHLTKLIQKRLPEHASDDGGSAGQQTWYENPYRGLQAFDVQHAPVFTGRTRAIGEIKQALVHQAASERAFVLVFGMSGCGKSSLVRAGLLPTLTQPGVIEGIGLWRWGVFRPADTPANLFDGLARCLLGPQALPELKALGQDADELADLLREAPKRAVSPIRTALEKAAEAVTAAEKLQRPPVARLAVVVDQMEEMFTLEGVDARQREGFVAALAALARSGVVWVIATMRSDFYPRCSELPELLSLEEGTGHYGLREPSFAEIGQMIRHPTRAAGLRFEAHPESGERLDDRLHEAAASDREALPLLEFILDQLYQQRTAEGVLTFAAYEQLGGLEGALARRAEEVLDSLDAPARQALPALLRALVTVGYREGEPLSSRRAPRARLDQIPGGRALVDAFTEARLLVTDLAEGQPVVGVAHEALLRQWPRVQRWLDEDRSFLRSRDRVSARALTWTEAGSCPDLLLQTRSELEEARQLLQRREELEPELRTYIEGSLSTAARAYRKRMAVAGSVTALIVLLAGVSVRSLLMTSKAQSQAVQAIANLIDIPQGLKTFNPKDSIRILALMYDANQKTLTGAADIAPTRRARAVNEYLKADELLLRGDYPGALRRLQAAMVPLTELAQHVGAHPDQRDLGVFCQMEGDIHDRLNESEAALNDYGEACRHFELAMDQGDPHFRPVVRRDLWYTHLLSANLQRRMMQLDGAMKACQFCTQITDAHPQEFKSQDLAQGYKELGDTLAAKRALAADQGNASQAAAWARQAQQAYARERQYERGGAADGTATKAQTPPSQTENILAAGQPGAAAQ